MKIFKVAFLGFGNAGRATARLLKAKEKEIKDRYKAEIIVTAITTGSRGSLVNQEGIDTIEACRQLEEKGTFDPKGNSFSTLNSKEVVESIDYDILVEITPLVIFSGQPAIDHIKGALTRKKDVVTANKGPIAWDYKNLKELAEKKGCNFFFETAVMDGTPIFNLVEDNLKFCKVIGIDGILNSTTNFILEEMEKGTKYEAIMEEGKKRGFIEADPAMDVEGYDAAAKVTALLNVLMEADITPDKIIRKGIENVTLEDVKMAKEQGKKIKLICKGYIEERKVVGKVEPTLLPANDLLANIDGTSSIVSIKTDLMGTVSIVETNPEIEQTAYGIFSDIIRIIDRTN